MKATGGPSGVPWNAERAKEELTGWPLVWGAAYCNGYFGYIASRRVLEEGGYEAGPWEPTLEDRIVEKVDQLDRQLRGAEP